LSQVRRTQLLIAFLCVALIVYFVLLGRIATELIVSGRPAAIGLGLALMVLPLIGLWVMVSALPRMPSGRIRRDAADELFQSVREDVERNPDDWRHWYLLARAYDYAGDRARAREAMSKAVEMQAHEERKRR
jgi:cytochrome c-type biogenesis protein CcmH/NrfG